MKKFEDVLSIIHGCFLIAGYIAIIMLL